jgi:hypothetical protein
LTGIDNGPVQIDLYVFGPDRAKAPHFTVERCAQPVYPKLPLHHGIDSMSYRDFSPKPESLRIVHPLLRKWVDGTAVATKLTASLSTDDMRDDIWFSWTPFSETGTNRFSHEGAWVYALNWGMGLIVACLLAAFFIGPGRGNSAMLKSVGLATGFGIILTLAVYLLLPKAEVRIVRTFRPFSDDFYSLQKAREIASEHTNLMEARAYLVCDMADNYLCGGLVREDDSPGNYQLRQVGGRVECVIYDASGAPSSE